jgi:putative peptidoglycan lipid II flippase
VALSRVTGLLRIVVGASLLGATVLGDLFVAINVLPLTLYDVFAGSAITSVLVPPLARLLGDGARDAAARLAANALGIITAAMAVVVVAAMAGRPLIARALTAGVDGDLRSDAVVVAGTLVLLIVPQLVLYAVIGVLVSIQHAGRRFLIPSAAPIVENVGLLATIGVVWWRYGGGLEVDATPTGMIVMLAVGSGLSVSAHAVVQYLGARPVLDRIVVGFDHRDRHVKALAGPARSSFGWSSTIALRQLALIVAAGFAGAGGVQAFEMATLAYFIPVALIGRPIASAALPRLADGAGPEAIVTGYRTALRLAAWLAVPAGLALVLLARSVASLISQGRFAEPEAVTLVTFALAGLGLGAAAEALFEVARQATMALPDRRWLVRSTWVRAASAAIGIPLAVVLIDGPAVMLALGLVVSVGDLCALALAHQGLRAERFTSPVGASRSTQAPRRRIGDRRHGPRVVAASLLAIVPVAGVAAAAVDGTPGIVATAAMALAVAVLYPASSWLVTRRGRMLKTLIIDLRSEELA